MVMTLHNADVTFQANTGDNVATAALNDRMHGFEHRQGLHAHRLLGRGSSMLPAYGKPGKAKPSYPRTDSVRRRSERPVWTASSPLPPAAWATLVITGAGQTVGQEQAVVRDRGIEEIRFC